MFCSWTALPESTMMWLKLPLMLALLKNSMNKDTKLLKPMKLEMTKIMIDQEKSMTPKTLNKMMPWLRRPMISKMPNPLSPEEMLMLEEKLLTKSKMTSKMKKIPWKKKWKNFKILLIT